MVFTGRGSRMRALLPYLRRDMRAHGGILDRIIFALIRFMSAARHSEAASSEQSVLIGDLTEDPILWH